MGDDPPRKPLEPPARTFLVKALEEEPQTFRRLPSGDLGTSVGRLGRKRLGTREGDHTDLGCDEQQDHDGGQPSTSDHTTNHSALHLARWCADDGHV